MDIMIKSKKIQFIVLKSMETASYFIYLIFSKQTCFFTKLCFLFGIVEINPDNLLKVMAGPTARKESFQFIYNGVQYDATEYAEKHPGGLTFLQNMKQVTKDFTEYFRYQRSYLEPYTPMLL